MILTHQTIDESYALEHQPLQGRTSAVSDKSLLSIYSGISGDGARQPWDKMTVLEALTILEAAVMECKKRNVNTPEVKAALVLLDPYAWPKWVIPQFRHHVESETEPLENREGQQQVLRATFPGIRDCVRELVRRQMDRLAIKFHQTKDLKKGELL